MQAMLLRDLHPRAAGQNTKGKKAFLTQPVRPYAECHDEDVKHMGKQGRLPRGEQGKAGQAGQPANSRWAENPRSHTQHPATQLPACQ